MKKKMSLMERVKIAERREAEAKRQAERDRKRFMEADLIAKGAMVAAAKQNKQKIKVNEV